MNRRDSAAALLVLAVSPLAGVCQQLPAMSRVGFLTPRSRPMAPNRDALSEAFTTGMRERGYVEGRNLTVEWRYLDGPYAGLDKLAADLVGLNVDVVVAYGAPRCRRPSGPPGRFRSSSPRPSTPSAAAWSRVCRGPAATPLGCRPSRSISARSMSRC